MVAWRNRKLIVFLPSTVLDDLDRTNYYSDPEYIGAFGKHEKLILRKTAAAIDAGRIDQEGRVQLTSDDFRSEEHTSELQSLMRISYAVFCLKKKKKHNVNDTTYKI